MGGTAADGGERRESGKRGRKPGRKAQLDKQDMKAKLERSRQSARECRARKKLRYQYLEELVADREKAVLTLRKELDKFYKWNLELDQGRMPEGVESLLKEMGVVKQEDALPYWFLFFLIWITGGKLFLNIINMFVCRGSSVHLQLVRHIIFWFSLNVAFLGLVLF